VKTEPGIRAAGGSTTSSGRPGPKPNLTAWLGFIGSSIWFTVWASATARFAARHGWHPIELVGLLAAGIGALGMIDLPLRHRAWRKATRTAPGDQVRSC
jgi:hypothetical protein